MLKSLFAAFTLVLLLPSCDPASEDDHTPSGKHQSTAVIQILPSTPVLADPALRTENFIANEIASLSMGEVLRQAASKNGWKNRNIKVEDVQKSLKAERITGTDMARITVYSDDAALAKETVEGIIEAYIFIRQRTEVDMSERRLAALDHELIAQSDLVQDLRKDLTVLIQQYGIPYFQSAPNPVGQTELELFATSRKQLQKLKIESTLLKGKLRVLEGNQAEREKLVPQIEVLAAQIDALGDIVDDRQDDTVDLSLKQHTYQQAKDTYEQSLGMLQSMKARQQEARIARKMPLTPLIIRQKAR